MAAGSEDGDSSPKAASNSTKPKKTPKSKPQTETEPKELPKKRVYVKLKKIDHDGDHANMTNGKVPLLDQNPVIEGSRNRKTTNKLVIKDVSVAKRGSKAVQIPNGRGKALIRITNVYNRIKTLDDAMIKTLHRGLFGKGFGKTSELLNNISLFRGFDFKKDSDEYNEKYIDLSKKFTLQEMKTLIYSFDLEMNYKTKEEAVTCILDFLVDPQPSKNPKKSVLEGHPRRKATKRDYFEADLTNEYTKKKKKRKAVTKESEEESSSKKSTKKSKNDVKTDGEKDEPERGDDESENEKESESKKPAKKRKSNQVIEPETEEESPKDEPPNTKAKKKKGSKN